METGWVHVVAQTVLWQRKVTKLIGKKGRDAGMEGYVFVSCITQPEKCAAVVVSPVFQRECGDITIWRQTSVVSQGTDCTTGDGVVESRVLPITT